MQLSRRDFLLTSAAAIAATALPGSAQARPRIRPGPQRAPDLYYDFRKETLDAQPRRDPAEVWGRPIETNDLIFTRDLGRVPLDWV